MQWREKKSRKLCEYEKKESKKISKKEFRAKEKVE